jgi:hypothetical protein
MSSLPIAANLPSSTFAPLVLLLLGTAVLSILASRARGHDDRERAERLTGIGFLLVLAAAAYTLVLVIAAIVGYYQRVWDMLIILFVFIVFFTLLLFVFFLLAEVIPRALRRGGER